MIERLDDGSVLIPNDKLVQALHHWLWANAPDLVKDGLVLECQFCPEGIVIGPAPDIR